MNNIDLLNNLNKFAKENLLEQNYKIITYPFTALYFDSIDSTNVFLKKFSTKIPDKTIVIANQQINGIGRNNHIWESQKDLGLYASIIFKEDFPLLDIISILSGLSIAMALRHCHIWLKWPNDLILKEKKLGGILCQSSYLGRRKNHTIVGIGININHTKDQLFPNSTSLKNEFGKSFDKFEILHKILIAFESNLLKTKSEIICEYKKYCITLNKQIFVNNSNIPVFAKDIDMDGSLIIEDENGIEKKHLDATIRGIKGYL